jgi:signal transduction histidine kinase
MPEGAGHETLHRTGLAKAPRMNEDQIRRLLFILADENERLGSALDSMLDGIILLRRAPPAILFNKSSERLIPFSSVDIYDRPVWEA